MIKSVGKPLIHWSYLIALEEDLARLSRFVEFTRLNFGTYSIELMRILFAAAAEADVVAKQLCNRLDPQAPAKNIDNYRTILMEGLPVMARVEVRLERYGLSFEPWSNWRRKVPVNPDWWGAYNDVKHHRHDEYRKANLRHALNAVAGLYVLLMFFYRSEAEAGDLLPHPSLLLWGKPFGAGSVLYHPSGIRRYRFEP